MGLPEAIARRLRLPLVVAPMFRVSSPELVVAACRAGVIGAFPTANCRNTDELEVWLKRMQDALSERDAPFCPNLIIQHPALHEHLAVLVKHKVELVITSVGSPAVVVEPLHAIGCTVFADVATLRHARRALDAGADGLVLLSAGAGGQTGWLNGLAFARAVRRFFDGPLVLAGGIADGHALWAARALGCDLGYMGTRFIATHESLASHAYRQMIVDCEMDDVLLTRAFTGLPTNMLRPSIIAAGLDPSRLPEDNDIETAARMFGAQRTEGKRWEQIRSAGHTVSSVLTISRAVDLIEGIALEYTDSRAASCRDTYVSGQAVQ